MCSPKATLEFEVELLSWTKKQKGTEHHCTATDPLRLCADPGWWCAVTDDKQVMKEIETEGEGWNKPNEGAKVTGKHTTQHALRHASESPLTLTGPGAVQ